MARLMGIASAPVAPEAMERIAVLRDDPMETPEVRAAARARLLKGDPYRMRGRDLGRIPPASTRD